MLSGLMGTLVSGGLLIRNALGFAGLLVILLLTVVPALKILVLYMLYSFAAALLQPAGRQPDDCSAGAGSGQLYADFCRGGPDRRTVFLYDPDRAGSQRHSTLGGSLWMPCGQLC